MGWPLRANRTLWWDRTLVEPPSTRHLPSAPRAAELASALRCLHVGRSGFPYPAAGGASRIDASTFRDHLFIFLLRSNACT